MRFDYDYYRKMLFLFPLLSLVIFSVAFIIGTITITIFLKKPFKNKTLNKLWDKKIIRIMYILLMSLILIPSIIRDIGNLQYGIYLGKESPKDAIVLQGEIEEIKELKNPFVHTFKGAAREFDYEIKDCNAHLITISGKQYYFMIKGELKVNDKVEIIYLPKSTIVLEVNIVEE